MKISFWKANREKINYNKEKISYENEIHEIGWLLSIIYTNFHNFLTEFPYSVWENIVRILFSYKKLISIISFQRNMNAAMRSFLTR